jgi:uncharacterized protein YecT (DUF1311 family)
MRLAILAALSIAPLLSPPPAAAESIMPPGSSPESGLKGVWRIVSAKTAPWAAPRPVTKKNAPFLEYAVEFAEGQVKGPAPLGCEAAKYSSGVAGPGEAFGGRLGRDADGSLANKLNLADGAPSLFRVYCGKETRDYYVDKHSALTMVEGGIVYTLERPDSQDPEQNKVGYSGPSFDCTKAKTTGERLICGDAALSKSDRALANAYGALKRSLPPGSFATFQAGQRGWLTYANKSCGADGAMPEAAGEGRRIAECLTSEFDSRTELLKDLTPEKSGSLVLEPRMRFRADADRHVEETDIYPWMSGDDVQASAFNEFISKTFELGKWRMDDKEVFDTGDDPGEMKFHAHSFYTVTRFDGRIVSLQVSSNDYTGGNRDNLSQGSYAWDLERGRLVTLADIFATGKNWKKFVAGLCKENLDRREGAGQGAISDEEIAATVSAGASWLWGKGKATVVFMPGTIGGVAAGEFDAGIPLEKLRPYMKPDAPVK